MEARIVEFAEVLRQNGVKVATSEVLDAARASTWVDLADREAFRSMLRTTLVKRTADRAPFDRAFEVFFSGGTLFLEGLEQSLLDELAATGILEGDERTMVLATLQQLAGEMSPLTLAALQGDAARLAQLFRGASLQLDFSQLRSPLQTGFYARRMLSGAGGDGLRTDIGAIEAELQRRGISAQGFEWVSRRLGDVLRALEADARQEADRQARARLRGRSGTLVERSFAELTRAELAQVQLAVRRLAERLKTRIVRRQKSRRRGILNVRRTLRRNLSWGGMPMVPVFRARRPLRPEVVVLCDVSDSVRNVSRLMLLFTHTLQALFSRVRSFVFVSDLGEVTDLFRGLEPEKALDVAVTGKAVSLQSNSNYGRAFVSFVQRELAGITRRTTVLIIGDGRNNQNPPQVWALREIRRKARRVIWICPEDRRGWGFGDSEMDLYAQVCDQVVVVQSLADLDRLADQLIPDLSHSVTDSKHDAGDFRTLAYASLRIDEALLQRLMVYQRALANRLTPGWDGAAMARAHQEALGEAGLLAEQLERPLAVLRRFAGNRETAGRLRAAEATATGEDRVAIQARLATLDARLRARDDPETIDRLLAHEPELLDLHRRNRGALGT